MGMSSLSLFVLCVMTQPDFAIIGQLLADC